MKQITAVVLLTLMLFIQAVQSFHTHSWPGKSFLSFNTARTHLSAFHHCSICDFQFARDTDEPQQEQPFQPLAIILLSYTQQPLQLLQRQKTEVSSRGPPAMVRLF